METPTPRSHIISQYREITRSNLRVFQSLTALFLPIAAAAALYPTLRSLPPSVQIALAVIISVTYLIITPCAISSISYVALLGRNGDKPSVSDAVKSISSSFLLLLATLIASNSVIALAAIIGYILILVSSASIIGIVISAVILVPPLTYVQVNWTVAYQVVIFESVWGLAALRRSRALVRGNEWLVVSLSLSSWVVYAMLFWNVGTFTALTDFFDGTIGARSRADWWFQLILQVVLIVISSLLFAGVQSGNIVANTMLYVYCRNTHHGVGGEDFSGEYLSLPVNGQTVASLA